MSLLQDINKTVNINESHTNVISTNITLLAENINESDSFITEAITNWLAKVGNVVKGGRLDPQKAKSVAEILGAVTALGSPDIAAAFDEKGDLGTVLYMASSKNPQESNAALKRLREIGRHPSAKTHTNDAKQAIQEPTEFQEFVNKAKAAIDSVMRKQLAAEKSKTSEDPNDSTAPVTA